MKIVLAAALALGASVASADTLWHQAPDFASNGVVNAIAGAPPFGVTAYTVADVHIGAGGATVDSITMYWSRILSDWVSDVNQGRVYVHAKTGAVPTALPGGPLMAMTVTEFFDPVFQQAGYAVTVSGLNLSLTEGDYWMGITPVAPGGPFGPELGMGSASSYGDQSMTYDAGGFPSPGWFNYSNVDAAITVTGVPAPATAGLLGLGLVAAGRRRRN